jgi:acetyl esterase/lipase
MTATENFVSLSTIAFPLVCLFAMTLLAETQPPVTMKLWPHGAPGMPVTTQPETSVNRPELNGTRGSITRITNVTEPTLSVYRPTGVNSGAAIVVFPGGGYNWLAMDIEGSEVCDWFTHAGVTCIVVKYRVPQSGEARYQQPLQDAQRALGVVRQHAKEWSIDPDRIGVLGFSAGGHVAAVLSNYFQHRTYPAIDEADQQSCRPNFTVLVYPAYLATDKKDGSVTPEVKPSADTPPTFLFQTEDDHIGVENSLFYYAALKNAKVQAEMHVYPEGGHGYGMRSKANAVATVWPSLVVKWLQSIRMLPASNESVK